MLLLACFRTYWLALVFALVCAVAPAQSGPPFLRVTVQDEGGKPARGVTVTIAAQTGKQWSGKTDRSGVWQLTAPAPGSYSVTISGEKLQDQTKEVTVAPTAELEIQFTAISRIAVHQEVTVQGTADSGVQAGASPPAALSQEEIKSVPAKPATVSDALPLLPGVARIPTGEIEIGGASVVHSAMIVNSVDVTDPQTGQFGLTVPVDAVDSLNVYQTPYLACYGRFTSGLVAVETKRGGDKWHFDLQDPFPEFRIRSGHLAGLRSSSPRVTFGGPLIKDRLFSATSFEYNLEKTPVRTLPFPVNESRHESQNLFTQFDYVISQRHVLTATLHSAPQNVKFANLDFFNPQPVTPNLNSFDQTGTMIDRFNFSSGVLQSTFAARTSDFATAPQGTADMFLRPGGNSGNYFSSQDRYSRRYEGQESFSLNPFAAFGTHNIQAGAGASGTHTDGFFHARPVDIFDGVGNLRRQVDFQGGKPYIRSDLELDGFVQDHWVFSQRFSLDSGVRIENQRLSSAVRVAPRLGFALELFPRWHTVVRGGAGIFYEHVPLSVYAFPSYPHQVITTFDAGGMVIDGPRPFLNVINRHTEETIPLASRAARAGNFIPYSIAGNVEIEQRIASFLKLRTGFLQNESHGLVTIHPGQFRGHDALILSGDGGSRYQQFEITSVFKIKNVKEMFVSYVRSRSRGSIDQFNAYLGDVTFPVVRPGQFTNLSGDLPNRFLAWGTVDLPLKVQVSPMVEVHTGFPYAVTNLFQQYAGVANSDQTRFPDFFALDARLRRTFPVTPKYNLQLALTGLNLTNHFNALAVHSNTDDPQFGQFFGTYKRRFRIDFDVLF